MDKRFDYPSIVAIKIIIKKADKILLIREPETNEWMPGRLGLPGGKVMLNESLPQAIERKIRTEIGLEIKLSGLIKIIDILMPEKNVYHCVFQAKYISGEISLGNIEAAEMKWFSADEVEKLGVDDFTEYYNISILKAVLSDKLEIFPIDIISVQDNRQPNILDWMEKGNKK